MQGWVSQRSIKWTILPTLAYKGLHTFGLLYYHSQCGLPLMRFAEECPYFYGTFHSIYMGQLYSL